MAVFSYFLALLTTNRRSPLATPPPGAAGVPRITSQYQQSRPNWTRLDYKESMKHINNSGEITIVEVDDLPQARRGESGHLSHGYWVEVNHLPPLFFDAPEPAYVYGRAARMSGLVNGWEIFRAAYQVENVENTARDVHTVYVIRRSLKYPHNEPEREILRRFAEGANPDSSHWPHP